MDPVTHGLIGASATQSIAAEDKLKTVTFVGLVSGMIADLDILISNPADPLLNLEIHRQFSHAFIFIPAGALIASALLWWFFRNRLSFKQLYFYSLLGYATSGITDTLTSYGTKLLWPFWDERFSWNIISVFDPFFSAGILLGIGFSFYKQSQKFARWGLFWMALYLLLGVIQQQRGKAVAHKMAGERNHEIERLVVKPTLANILLWSIRYESDDTLYADGVHLSPFRNPIVYRGESAPLLNWTHTYGRYSGSTLYNDINRFDTLSDSYLVRHPHQPLVLGDGRYAMLPTRINPLWGITVDTTAPHQHLEFHTYRKVTPQLRSTYIDMLFGY